MCGRFNIIDNPALRALLNRLGVCLDGVPVGSLTSLNIAPTESAHLVRVTESGERVMESASWWFLLQNDAPEPRPDTRWSSFNARAERMFASRLYKGAARHHRCIVPAAGYYEWVSQQGVRVPHYVEPVSGCFAFAGLYRHWHFQNQMMATTSVVTTPAHPALRWLHEKSTPLMLDEGDFDRWLNPAIEVESALQDLWQPRLVENLRVTAVSPAMNNARNKSGICLQPVAEPVMVDSSAGGEQGDEFRLV